MIIILALVLSFVPALLYTALVYGLDVFEPAPLWLIAGVFGWGAVVAAIGSLVFGVSLQIGVAAISHSALVNQAIGGVVIAPIVEESFKGLAVLLVFAAARHEIDSFMDGIVFAIVTALGFAATENVMYLIRAGFEGGVGNLMALFIERVVLGGWIHATFTLWLGIGLAAAHLCRSRVLRIGLPPLGWLLAVLAHASYNLVALLTGNAGVAGLMILIVADGMAAAIVFGAITWAMHAERRWMEQYLAEEVALGVLSPAHYRAARSLRGLVRAQWRAVLAGQYWPTRRFYCLCGDLAQKKHQWIALGDERGAAALVARLRDELIQLAPRAHSS